MKHQIRTERDDSEIGQGHLCMSESGQSSVHGSLVTSEVKRRVPGLKPICDQRKKKALPKLKPIGGQQNSQKIELKVDIQSWRRHKDQIEKRMKLEKIDRIKITESFKNDENDTGVMDCSEDSSLKRAWKDVRELNSNEFKSLEKESIDFINQM